MRVPTMLVTGVASCLLAACHLLAGVEDFEDAPDPESVDERCLLEGEWVLETVRCGQTTVDTTGYLATLEATTEDEASCRWTITFEQLNTCAVRYLFESGPLDDNAGVATVTSYGVYECDPRDCSFAGTQCMQGDGTPMTVQETYTINDDTLVHTSTSDICYQLLVFTNELTMTWRRR